MLHATQKRLSNFRFQGVEKFLYEFGTPLKQGKVGKINFNIRQTSICDYKCVHFFF